MARRSHLNSQKERRLLRPALEGKQGEVDLGIRELRNAKPNGP